jgi:hypothetical protein
MNGMKQAVGNPQSERIGSPIYLEPADQAMVASSARSALGIHCISASGNSGSL